MTMVISGTDGLTFPNSTVQASAGYVLQVVHGSTSTAVSNSTSTLADTGLTATITPKFATSKILVIVNQSDIYKQTNDTSCRIQLIRNSTSILQFAAFASGTASTANNLTAAGASWLDSPATTSAVTYKTMFLSVGNTPTITLQFTGGSSTSTITLMEIAG